MKLCSSNIWTNTSTFIYIENIVRLVLFIVLLWLPKSYFDWWFYFSVQRNKIYLQCCNRYLNSQCKSWSYSYINGFALTTILVIIFWDFLMFYQIFLSPQVKRIVIISNKHAICGYMLHELPNDIEL